MNLTLERILVELGRLGLSAGLVVTAIKLFFDHRLKRGLETHKAELDRHTERIKYDMQRDFINAELKTKVLHQIYPALFEKLTKAEGTISGLMGSRPSTAWSNMPADEVRLSLGLRGVSPSRTATLMATFATDPKKAEEEIEKLLHMLDFGRAKTRFQRAKNFRLLKVIYISQSVNVLVEEFEKLAWSAFVGYQMTFSHGTAAGPNFFEKGREDAAAARNKLDEIRAIMGRELSPAPPA